MKRCNTCQGEYEPVQADGAIYFHACPPVLQYFDASGVVITRDQAAAIAAAGGVAWQKSVERPNKRDENPSGQRDRAGHALMKAEGAGASEIVRVPGPLDGAVRVTGG